jgi:hypothetical protein
MGLSGIISNNNFIYEDYEKTQNIEQINVTRPKFTDWSEKGKFNWENAKIKNIITYIREVDTYFGGDFLKNPSYTTMLSWYLNHDNPEVRLSLKEWMFNDIYYGITRVTDRKETKKNVVAPDEYDMDLQKELETILTTASKIDLNKLNITDSEGSVDKTLTKNIKTLISSRTLEKLNKELIALNKGNVFLKKDILEPLKTNLNDLITYSKNTTPTDDDIYDKITDVVDYLLYFDLKDKDEIGLDIYDDDVKISVNFDQRSLIKTNVIKKLTTEISSLGELSYKSLFDKIIGITISNDPGELNQLKLDGTEKDPIVIMKEGDSEIYQYPSVSLGQNDRTNLGNNFFPDDGTTLTAAAVIGINEQVRALKKYIEDQESEVYETKETYKLGDEYYLDVVSINIYTYSSTSKVRTAYKSIDKTFNESNNIKLAEDRNKVIENAVRGALNKNGLSNYNIILASKEEKPNVGLGWVNTVGKYQDGTDATISEYEPMFKLAYEKNNKLTPQLFYGNRTNKWADRATKILGRPVSQQELSAEYNKTYGKFRMNVAGINATMKKPTIITKEEESEEYLVIAVPGMGIELQVKPEFQFKPPKPGKWYKKLKRKVRKAFELRPKSFRPPKTTDKHGCPYWG